MTEVYKNSEDLQKCYEGIKLLMLRYHAQKEYQKLEKPHIN